MDIINRLHSTFKDCEYFEFGEDYVKFFDKEVGKTFMISIKQVEIKKCAETHKVSDLQNRKAIKVTSKEKKKTWESILKAKNNGK